MKMKKVKAKPIGSKKDESKFEVIKSTSHVNGVGNNSAYIAGLIKRGNKKGFSMGTIENL